MERGYCSLTGSNKYSPQLLRDRVASSPAQVGQLVLRGVRMVTSLGTFFGSLALDDIMGRSDDMELVALRAAQLRFECRPCHSPFPPSFLLYFPLRGVRALVLPLEPGRRGLMTWIVPFWRMVTSLGVSFESVALDDIMGARTIWNL
jgi:hypothetical protein